MLSLFLSLPLSPFCWFECRQRTGIGAAVMILMTANKGGQSIKLEGVLVITNHSISPELFISRICPLETDHSLLQETFIFWFLSFAAKFNAN